MTGSADMIDSVAVKEQVISTLDEHKAIEITCISLHGHTQIADEMIICTALSTRHAQALAEKLQRALKTAGISVFGIEGQVSGEWILVDVSDVIVHIMLKDTREFYQLEALWPSEQSPASVNEN